jgi:PIN domain nuclease of toxin-antitoxin system
MRLLLDTQIVYWWYYQTARLPAGAIEKIRDAEEVCVSAATLWEIAIKARLGKINANPSAMLDWIGRGDFHQLPIQFHHAIAVATLPMHHSDPFDRLLVAQAQIEGLRLLTTDGKLAQYGESVIKI